VRKVVKKNRKKEGERKKRERNQRAGRVLGMKVCRGSPAVSQCHSATHWGSEAVAGCSGLGEGRSWMTALGRC